MRGLFKKLISAGLATILFCFVATPAAWAFCGFFAVRGNFSLGNSASRVVIAHKGNHSVFTMQNNFEGDVGEFARIVPIPVIPTRQQVRIGDNNIIDLLDRFTSPRLIEYYDTPCKDEYILYELLPSAVTCLGFVLVVLIIFTLETRDFKSRLLKFGTVFVIVCILMGAALPTFLNQAFNRALQARTSLQQESGQVTIADQFAVGEYDVTLLSATESDGLANWLQDNGYRVPTSAKAMLQDYIQQGMKFFVVRVNLERFGTGAPNFLRPIVIEYDSPQLMLPIRLGTLNAAGDYQDVIVYILTEKNTVELVNYPTLPIPTDAISTPQQPSGQELPEFVKDNFQDFYEALFQQQYERAGKRAGFWEYIGPLADLEIICNPCTMSREDVAQLRAGLGSLGVFWDTRGLIDRVMVTRLHVRYTADQFPEDLQFHEVDEDIFRAQLYEQKLVNRNLSFHARYVTRRSTTKFCVAGFRYAWVMRRTRDNLARLTGWSREEIEQRSRSRAGELS